MKRVKRLAPAVEVAAHRENEMSGHLRSARDDLELQETRRDTLRAYLDEYTARQAGTNHTSLAILRERRAFLGRLDEALREQELRVVQARDRLEQTAATWRESRARVQALEGLVERIQAEDRVQEGRREQAATDEAGSRCGRRWS